ncbi:aBC transporter related protein [Clostridium sp. CAG:354]|nr:ABC transporter ATP-binding protein [Clostridium sp.]MBS5863268.1 ABC transporter ATP-binding protein [Clostridium sp.]CDE10199.1 aBC transporter related protein [Clostridium sp. CAG:354]
MEGDILGFIGPNGAGKTTTIKLILGLQNITSGKVYINGYDIEENFKKAIENVGTIVESPDLYMYMSGYENLKLVANLYKNVDKKRIDEIVKLVGLENRIKDKVSKYSLGMRQRLGIAQAILHKPKLLILDEPTNGLDPEGIKEVKVLLKKLAEQENMAILISSHNLAELDTFCNKISIIKNGEIVETNDIDTFKKDIKNNCYILEVEDSSVIGSIIDYKMDILTETEVRVYIEKEQVPLLIKELVLRNIKIYNVSEENLSLEDAFLKKTGGNVIE